MFDFAQRIVLRSLSYWAAVLMVSSLLLPVGAGSRADRTVRTLQPGKPIEQAVTAGRADTYAIAMTRGQVLRIRIDARNGDLNGALLGPDGTELASADSPDDLGDPATVLLLADQTGVHTLKLHTTATAPVRYTVEVRELRPATPEDGVLAVAQSLAARGARLRKQHTSESLLEAVGLYKEALASIRKTTARSAEPPMLRSVVQTYFELDNIEQALSYSRELVRLEESLADARGQATGQQYFGRGYLALGETHKALEAFNKALALARSAADQETEVEALNSLGLTRLRVSDHEGALEYYKRALDLVRTLGDRAKCGCEPVLLLHIGQVYAYLFTAS